MELRDEAEHLYDILKKAGASPVWVPVKDKRCPAFFTAALMYGVARLAAQLDGDAQGEYLIALEKCEYHATVGGFMVFFPRYTTEEKEGFLDD